MHPSQSDDNLPTLALGQHPPTDTPPGSTAPPPASGPTAPTAPGDEGAWPTIPGYEVEGTLGRGGMGVVYRARHLGLNRPVALKVLRARANATIDAARFQREARAVARLRHPNIVAVYDAGTYCDAAGQVRPYIALEFVAGTSLDQALRRAALPPEEAADLARDLARALAAVHEQGIVHRDIKPANVLLGEGSSPKLTDFGLALFDDDLTLTRGEELLGTPGYLSPEQVRSGPRAAGPASDVHALGAVLYECLTGRPAFKAASLHDVLEQVVASDPVPPGRLNAAVPRDLETITLKCLQKDPARRYASAAELAEDLDRYLAGQPIRARRVSPPERAWRWARRRPALAGLALACAGLTLTLVAGAAWFIGRLGDEAGRRRAADVAAAEISATSSYHGLLAGARQRGDRREPGWRRAGLADVSRAAALATRARSPLELRNLAAWCLLGTDVRPLPAIDPGLHAHSLAFDPKRPALAVAEFKSWLFCSVVVLAPDGKKLHRLSFLSRLVQNGKVQDGARCTAFSPDGRWLVVGARSGWLHRWDLTRAEPAVVSWPGHKGEVRDVCFCPEGQALFTAGADGFVRRWSIDGGWKRSHERPGSGRLDARAGIRELLLADGSSARLLNTKDLTPAGASVPARGAIGRLTAPGGPLVFADGARLHLVSPDTGDVAGALRAPNLEAAHEGAIDDAAVSPDGGLLASVDEATRHARVWELASGRLLANLTLPGTPCRVAWRADGRALAVLAGTTVLRYEIDPPAAMRFAGLSPHPALVATYLPADRLACLTGDRTRGRGELALWSLTDAAATCQDRQPVSLPESRLPVRLVADAGGRRLAWTEAGRLAVAPTERLAEARPQPTTEVWGLAFAPDGRLWYNAEKTVFALPPDGGPAREVWCNQWGHHVKGLGNLWPVACGPAGSLVGGRDGVLRLFSHKGELKNSWARSRREIRCVAIDAGGEKALVGTGAGEVCLIAVPSGEVLAEPAPHADQVEAALFLAGGLAATASADGVLRLWQRDGEGLTQWLSVALPAPVKGLARDPDGGRLAIVLAGERAARVLNIRALREALRAAGVP